jgi:hypothetical protein
MLYHVRVIGNDADGDERVKKLVITKKGPYEKQLSFVYLL